MERWNGRVALVTGASAGIGAAICTELTKYGIKVIGCAREVHRIDQLAKALPPGSLVGIKCDLRNESDITNMFKEIKEKHGGRLDICINNAGYSKLTSLIDGKTEDFRGMFEVNVLALCICTREAIKMMRENNIDDGQIININSIVGHMIITSVPGTNYYSATKHMVRIVTEGLRRDLKDLKSHIRVAEISPGYVKTEFLERVWNKAAAEEFLSSFKPLSSADISTCVISILQTPKHVDINDIMVRPVESTAQYFR